MKLELAWRGLLFTRGLPVCPQVRLRGTDSRQAIDVLRRRPGRARPALREIFVPNQAPFGIRANLLAFNGQTKVGRPAVLVHAYTTDPARLVRDPVRRASPEGQHSARSSSPP